MKKFMFVFCVSALGALPFFARAQSNDSDREKVHQAFETCREQLGLAQQDPGQGRPAPPSEEERQAMDACLTEQGIDVSQLHQGPPPGAPREGRAPRDSSSGGGQ